MTIMKCDACGAIIDRRQAISIGRGWLPQIELCGACGAPAAELLDRFGTNRDALLKEGYIARADHEERITTKQRD